VTDEPPPQPAAPADPPDEPVPKLPRGRGMKFSKPELFRIGMTLLTLVGVMMLAKPCANSVSGFVMSMDGSGSSGSAAKSTKMPRPNTVDVTVPQQYEKLRPGMTDEEVKAAIVRSKARAAGSSQTP
jgi:hypothetical protein